MDLFQPSPRLEEALENYSKADVEFRDMCYCLGESIVLQYTEKLRQRYPWFDYHTRRIFGSALKEEETLLDYNPARYNELLRWNRIGDVIAQAANLLDFPMENIEKENRSGFGFVGALPVGIDLRPFALPEVLVNAEIVAAVAEIVDRVVEVEVEAAEEEPGIEPVQDIAEQIVQARQDHRFQVIVDDLLQAPEHDNSSVSNSSLERTLTIKSNSSSGSSEGENFDGSLNEVFRRDLDERDDSMDARVEIDEDQDGDADVPALLHIAEIVVLPPVVPIVVEQVAPVTRLAPSRKRREPSTLISPKDEVPRKKVCRMGNEVSIHSVAELKKNADELLISLADLDLGFQHLDILDKIQKVRSSVQRCAKTNQAMSARLFKLQCRRINEARIQMGIRA